jgi:UDP-glucuronate 4-epimerase
MTVLVTGAAGFIGMHVAKRLLERGEHVLAVDDINSYYDRSLKKDRIAALAKHRHFSFAKLDISDTEEFAAAIQGYKIDRVVHLAAQAGVRYSLENPFAYEKSNLAGQLVVLEACRHLPKLKHLVYASSSSVYGDRPSDGSRFREEDPVDQPVSLYAATKRAGELMVGTYTRLWGLNSTGLRFFTVYGPWGRPDMAYFEFTRRILSGEPIRVFGYGRMSRDFTYIDDVVDGVIGVLDSPPAAGEHRIVNVASGSPVGLMDMIRILESKLNVTASIAMEPMQAGDVSNTHADIRALKALTGFTPRVALEEGLAHFVRWYCSRYKGRVT